ncbi:MAG: potassium uptake protein, TrkH family [Oscillospiraceae bacterium]|jgi:trk system potassium uptake protein TrkH|nr:potassium uptake protein, TrkH family [Oscillospiraceae bacterium]
MLIKKLFRRIDRLSPTRSVPLVFVALIFAGTLILMLPVCSKSGEGTSFIHSFFASASAVCVTGFTMWDVWSYWSPLGQGVLLALIQIGGLGFMCFVSIFSFLLGRTIGLKERLIMVQSLSLNDINGVVRTVRHVLYGTLIFEGAGAVLLTLCFWKRFGFFGALIKGIFHSVSAFCNAGLDLMGETASFAGFSEYATNPIVCLTLGGLIVVGGLGFFVWEDIYRKRSFGELMLHSKLVIVMSGLLIALGGLLYFVFEYSNPGTIGGFSLPGKALAALYQSAAMRTSGMLTVDHTLLTGPSKLLTVILMVIGGSPGSTAGGLKTVAAAILVISAAETIRGKREVNIAGRHVPQEKVHDCMTMFFIVLVSLTAGMAVLLVCDSLDMGEAFGIALSAVTTLGLRFESLGTLSAPSLTALAALMFLGRVGMMTFGISTLVTGTRKEKIHYPDTQILIG